MFIHVYMYIYIYMHIQIVRLGGGRMFIVRVCVFGGGGGYYGEKKVSNIKKAQVAMLNPWI